MPYRCTSCRKLTNDESETADCEKGGTCDLKKVGVVHLLHPDGPGKVVSTGRREVLRPDGERGNRGKVQYETVDMHLCCNSRADRPQMTDVRSAATCLTCLTNVPEPEKDRNDEDLDTPAPQEPDEVHQLTSQTPTGDYDLQGATREDIRPLPDPQNDPENAGLSDDPSYTEKIEPGPS